jgi:glycosyltransferase involved in cell wall biosynthesis
MVGRGLRGDGRVSATRDRRVVLVTNQIDKIGGLERYVEELAVRLPSRGFEVRIIAKGSEPGPRRIERRADGMTIVRTWAPSKRTPWFAAVYGLGVPYVSRQEIARFGPDAVVHGHFFAPMLAPALQRGGYIQTFHGPVHKELLDEAQDSYYLPGPMKRAAVEAVRRTERLVLSRARLVTVLSEFMVTELAELGIGPERVLVLPGGVDTERFAPGPAHRPEWARAADPLLFCARRLAAGKGVLELVEAMPAVLAELPGAMLVIAGNGAERPRIEARIAELRCGDAVRLLGDLGGEALVGWMRTADLCVMPTQRPEPFGLTTVEALACGTPVVVTPGGASPELLSGLDARLVLDGAGPATMARGICRVAQDAELLASVRARARAHVHPRFSWETVADRWAEIYRER